MKSVLSNTAKPELANWILVLDHAAREVFRLMLNEELSTGNGHPPEPLDITAMIGLAGALSGVVSVRCSTSTAMLIAARMLGPDEPPTEAETWDAIGEICNMVAGNFKNNIPEIANTCMISVPTVISGADYCVHPFCGSERAEVRLAFQGHALVIAIEVHR